MLLGAGLVVAWWLQHRRVRSFWPYIFGAGVLSWLGFYRGGLHPALALVPIIPFLPHAARDPGLFVEAPHAHDTLNEFEHRFKQPVGVMLFFFGLANAGVVLRNFGPGTWFVLTSIVLGKPIGILAATGISTLLGLHLPRAVTWRDVSVIGIVAGIGFTVALFFATAAFPSGRLLDETKLGALLSFGAFFLAFVAAKALNVGRTARE
jgi:NhaA family Na+:H+ antiporter